MLRIPAGTADFFLLERAILNSLRMAGESGKVEIALIKASSSCLARNSSTQHGTQIS
jgi:hypothetical protein